MTRFTPAQIFVLVLSAVLVIGVMIGHRVSRESGDADAGPAVEYTLPEAGSTPITIHVVGAVRRPGLYVLEAGARVRDAIEAAGGLVEGADQQSVNLAAFVDDGDQVLVEAKETSSEPEAESTRRDRPPPDPAPRATPAAGPPTRNPSPPPSRAPATAHVTPRDHPATVGAEPSGALPDFARAPRDPKVRLNRAGLDELERIPGIGPELAKKIIYHRSMHGPFSSFEDIGEVPGIGPATIEKIRVSATLN
ncbi:MAG: helix-hairpin-helix domain-containing protein [Armatimonadota bacterium]